jgi:autotransporter-associated beta strand protein
VANQVLAKKEIKNMQKTPFTLCNHLLPAVLTAVLLSFSSFLQAQSSWDGGSTTGNSWGLKENWAGDVLPTFGTSANLIFNNLTRPDNDIGAARTVGSISYGADMDGNFASNFRNYASGGGTAGANLTLQAASGNASITVDPGASGNLNLGWSGTGTAGGNLILGSNLDIIHNGTGNLTFSRGITGAYGFTKTGTGTMVLSSAGSSQNTFTGNINVNGGTLLANSFVPATDMNNAANINLGGGTLVIANLSGVNKDYTNPGFNVTAPSVLAWSNTGGPTSYNLIFSGTKTFALGNNLTVKNSSTNTSLVNAINITRAITGSGDLIVDTYNNVNSGTANFSLGRVQLGGSNSAWSGNLVINKGTAELNGEPTLGQFNAGSGRIILGETGNSFGAGLLVSAPTNNGARTLANDITVRSGGFRTLRGSGDNNYTFSGGVALEGDLNVHNGLWYFDKMMTLSGNISGVGGLNITKSGTNAYTTRLMGNNTYAGATTIGTGASLNIFSASGNAIGDSSAVTFDGAGASLVFNTTDETVGSIASSGNNGAINLGGNLLTTGGNNADTAYGGTISGAGGRLAKTGSGTMTLSGANTYTGSTAVNQGTLTVNGSLAGGVDVSSGSLLKGSGTIGGASTVNGTLSAGNSPGQMTFSSDLTLGTGSNLVWELFGNTSSDVSKYDRITVGGGLLASNGSGITLDFGTTADGSSVNWSNSFWDTAQTWTFLTVAGTTSGFSDLSLLNTSFLDASGNSLADARSGSSFSITQSGSDVAISYVPEPSTGSLLLMGLASWALVRATRRTA